MLSYTLAELAEIIGAEVRGDATVSVSSIGTLAAATEGQISFLANAKYRSQLSETKASAVILSDEDVKYCQTNALVMKNAYLGFAKVAQALDTTPDSAENIHESAVIAADVKLADNVSVGANAVIETGVELGADVQIGAGCFIGKGARIGKGTKLWANVTVYHDCVIGEDCLIQSSAVIGSDGFGYANDAGKWVKIPQLGRAILGDRVEIGANSCIDRGALEDTVLHDGVIIDNLCQIAHNVEIGENTAVAGCTVIAGSTTIGKHCIIAGMVGINGHISIADGVTLTGFSMVTKAIKESGVYSSGIPAIPNKDWRKSMVGLRNLEKLSQRVKELEKHQK